MPQRCFSLYRIVLSAKIITTTLHKNKLHSSEIFVENGIHLRNKPRSGDILKALE
jgi:hypothetical protein